MSAFVSRFRLALGFGGYALPSALQDAKAKIRHHGWVTQPLCIFLTFFCLSHGQNGKGFFRTPRSHYDPFKKIQNSWFFLCHMRGGRVLESIAMGHHKLKR